MVELNEKALEVGQRVEKFTGEARWFGTILSTYTTGRGKVRHVVEVEPQGFQMIAVPEQLRPAPALPAPDDGQKKTEKFTLLAMASNYRGGHSWDHLDGKVCERAAAEIDAKDAALQSQTEQIGRLSVQLEASALVGVELSSRLEAAEQQVQKLTAENEMLREALTTVYEPAAITAGNQARLGITVHTVRSIVRDYLNALPFRSALETQEVGK